MKIKIELDESLDETEVIIRCREMTKEIQVIIDSLKEKKTEFIVAKKGEMQYILKPHEVHYFYADGDVIMAVTKEDSLEIKEKLYELEMSLPKNSFVRLSKSVIANLHELSRFEASFNGTLCVYFKSGTKEYVSRHYVGKIKEILNMKRRK